MTRKIQTKRRKKKILYIYLLKKENIKKENKNKKRERKKYESIQIQNSKQNKIIYTTPFPK